MNWDSLLMYGLGVVLILSILWPLLSKATSRLKSRRVAEESETENKEAWHVKNRWLIMVLTGAALFILMWYRPALIAQKHWGLGLVLAGIILYWASNPDLEPVWPGRFAVLVIVLGIFFWFSSLLEISWSNPTTTILTYLPDNWSHKQKIVISILGSLLVLGAFVSLIRGKFGTAAVAVIAMVMLWSNAVAFPGRPVQPQPAVVSTQPLYQPLQPGIWPPFPWGPVDIPASGQPYVEQASRLLGIPEPLLAAHCIQESGTGCGVDPNNVPIGGSGEIGWLQVLPATGQAVCGMNESTLHVPQWNFQCGARKLRACADDLAAIPGVQDFWPKVSLCYNKTALAMQFARTPWNQIPISSLSGMGFNAHNYVERITAILQSGGGGPVSLSQGGQFVRLPPQPTTPADSTIWFSEDGNQVTISFLPFREQEVDLAAGSYRVTLNKGPLPWANSPSASAFRPGENCNPGRTIVPKGCLSDTVIEIDGVTKVYAEGDLIELYQPARIKISHNHRVGDQNKKLSTKTKGYRREITLQKEG